MGRVFLMTGGGTGGHVVPSVAVARVLRARGHAVWFIGTREGFEAKLVPGEGFPIEWIEIGGLKRVGWRKMLRTAMQLPSGVARSMGLIRRRGADAVFSMGGYVAGPPAIAAWLMRRPQVLMEPNALPGLTNRWIGKAAWRALIAFDEAGRYFPRGVAELTGLPVRPEFFGLERKPWNGSMTVLITGGSRGSRTLNNAVRQAWPLLERAGVPVRLIHQTGAEAFESTARDFERTGIGGEVTAFINDMPAAYGRADVVVSRSGAGAVSELAAAGKPSILVPFPFAADGHQLKNAEAMQTAGAARLVLDGEMTGERLAAELAALADGGMLAAMGDAARRMARPGAAERAAAILEEAAG